MPSCCGQKQLSGNALQKNCSQKFRKILSKTPVLESQYFTKMTLRYSCVLVDFAEFGPNFLLF